MARQDLRTQLVVPRIVVHLPQKYAPARSHDIESICHDVECWIMIAGGAASARSIGREFQTLPVRGWLLLRQCSAKRCTPGKRSTACGWQARTATGSINHVLTTTTSQAKF